MPSGFVNMIKGTREAILAKVGSDGKQDGGGQQEGVGQQHHNQQQPFHAANQDQMFHGPIRPNGGKFNVGYFTNWSIYGRKYLVSKIPAESLSHILYAFADIRPDGQVFLTDSWADVEIHYEGDSWNDTGNNMYGCFKQLMLLKKQHRHLKLLLSIGGWTYSSHFAAVKTAAGRSTFVSSAMKILEDVGLDGLDIDWEYPKDAEEAKQYVQLLAELRAALNARSHALQGRHWLSIAAPCGGPMNTLDIRAMDQHLDMWNLMAYDFSGTWSERVAHQTNLLSTPDSSFSVDAAVSHYISQGVAPSKLVVGLPLYARAFANTDGMGQTFQGVPEGGAEPGNFFYSDLPLPGHTEQFDHAANATYSTCSDRREVASYDGPISVDSKIHYIKQRRLAGAMWWELSGDCDVEKGGMDRALIPRAARGLGQMEFTLNNLHYPHSQYDNMRLGM